MCPGRQDLYQSRLRALDRRVNNLRALQDCDPGEPAYAPLLAKAEEDLRALKREREQELPVDDRLLSRLRAQKACVARVEECSSQFDQFVAAFKKQQKDGLARLDELQAQHTTEINRRQELDEEVRALRAEQAATHAAPPPAVEVVRASILRELPTEPEALDVLIADCAATVRSCGDLGDQQAFTVEATAARPFLQKLFGAMQVRSSAVVDAALRPTVPPAAGESSPALRSAGPPASDAAGAREAVDIAVPPDDDAAMVQNRKRDADAAGCADTGLIALPRNELVASLGLAALDAQLSLAEARLL